VGVEQVGSSWVVVVVVIVGGHGVAEGWWDGGVARVGYIVSQCPTLMLFPCWPYILRCVPLFTLRHSLTLILRPL
jgi:hypothetical protein